MNLYSKSEYYCNLIRLDLDNKLRNGSYEHNVLMRLENLIKTGEPLFGNIQVVAAETVYCVDGQKNHVAYTILIGKVGDNDDEKPVLIKRRYSDFLKLYKTLRQSHPLLTAGISFPRKVILGNFASDVATARSMSFETFLQFVHNNDKLRESESLKWFLISQEELEAQKYLKSEVYCEAKPILENIFFLLNKIYTDRHPSVIIALCRLIACCSANPQDLGDAVKYAEIALRRFDGISDVDLLRYYVPLLQLCVRLWCEVGRDKNALESRLDTLKLHGHKVDGCPRLLDATLADK